MLTGRCLCGACAYEIEGEPVVVAHCHCLDCQRLSGAGHSTGAMFAESNIYERTLREVCGSEERFRLLRALFENPGREFHGRGLAAAAGIDPSNASKLLGRVTDIEGAEKFTSALCVQLGLPADSAIPAYEDAGYFGLRVAALQAGIIVAFLVGEGCGRFEQAGKVLNGRHFGNEQ